jgi:hypothetical protein
MVFPQETDILSNVPVYSPIGRPEPYPKTAEIKTLLTYPVKGLRDAGK